ncbi:MAG TPA: hypothetical protein G4O02_15290 [Caldilineae bacterium]|nr:hypothetical protein [Caldilineae bacterium]
MVRVTCMHCGRGYMLTHEQIARAVEESQGTKRKHYVADCPYCRHGTKVPLRPIRQAYARLKAMGVLPVVAEQEEATSASDSEEEATDQPES